MSKTLKRPMFRRGGTVNNGIMTGIVDRTKHADDPFVTGIGKRTDLLAPEFETILDKYTPKTRLPIGQLGLNLASGRYAGSGLLQNIAGSAMDPYREWTKADDARNLAESQRTSSAISSAIGQQFAERTARAKAAGSGMQKDYSTDRKYFQLLEKYSEAPKDRYSKTITNLYPHGMAEFGSRIQDNAYKSKEGVAVMQNLDGVVPHEIKGGQAQWQYEKMDPGAFYFHPQYKAFVQREPATENKPEQLVVYDPYTFKETRRVNLG